MFYFVYPVISDPEYLKQLKNGFTGGQQRAGPINIPSGSLPWTSLTTATSPVSFFFFFWGGVSRFLSFYLFL